VVLLGGVNVRVVEIAGNPMPLGCQYFYHPGGANSTTYVQNDMHKDLFIIVVPFRLSRQCLVVSCGINHVLRYAAAFHLI
jgi:hypothetical protein